RRRCRDNAARLASHSTAAASGTGPGVAVAVARLVHPSDLGAPCALHTSCPADSQGSTVAGREGGRDRCRAGHTGMDGCRTGPDTADAAVVACLLGCGGGRYSLGLCTLALGRSCTHTSLGYCGADRSVLCPVHPPAFRAI